jgi:hypothetical protein
MDMDTMDMDRAGNRGRDQSTWGDDDTTGTTGDDGTGAILWPTSPPQRPTSNRQVTDALSLRDGSFVTAEGRYDRLYRVRGGAVEPVSPQRARELGIKQSDIVEVPSAVFRKLRNPLVRRRAVGRDLNAYLWSDLNAGHFMESWVWLQGTTLTVTTQTRTVTWFGGWTGGVSVLLYDANGNRLNHPEIRDRYGVDGRAFGPGERRPPDTMVIDLPQDIANATESIVILHYWDPKVDILGVIIAIGQIVWELFKAISESQQRGEPINAGGEPF